MYKASGISKRHNAELKRGMMYLHEDVLHYNPHLKSCPWSLSGRRHSSYEHSARFPGEPCCLLLTRLHQAPKHPLLHHPAFPWQCHVHLPAAPGWDPLPAHVPANKHSPVLHSSLGHAWLVCLRFCSVCMHLQVRKARLWEVAASI